MDEHDEALMNQYGITAEAKILYHFEGYRYERLADAVNYAIKRADRQSGSSALPDEPR